MKVLLILLTYSALSFAGQGKGGGDVVVCYDENGDIYRMEAYDFWNASKKFNLEIKENEKETYMEKVKENLDRLKEIDPVVAEKLLKDSEIFSPENLRGDNDNVGLVPGINNNGDGVQSITPADTEDDCSSQQIERIAEFTANPLPFEKKFKITSHLWGSADEMTKYAIVQHEVIYQFFKSVLGETNSEKAQLYNAYISSLEFDQASPDSYREFVRGLGLNELKLFSLQLDGITYSLNGFFRNGKGYGGRLAKDYKTTFQNKEVVLSQVKFYPSGKIYSMRIKETFPLRVDSNNQFNVTGLVLLSEKQNVLQFDLKGWQYLNIYGKKYPVTNRVNFYKNGRIKSIYTPVCNRSFEFKGNKYRARTKGEYWVYFKDTVENEVDQLTLHYHHANWDNYCNNPI